MKVTRVKDVGRRLPWKLDGYFGGRRVRLFFATKGEAEAERLRLSGERGETGKAGDRLSPRERVVFAELRDRLAERGATMEEAVGFFLEHGSAPMRPRRLWDLLEEAIEGKEREGKADRYLTQLRSSVGSLCRWEGWGERWAHELTREAVEDWVNGNGWSGKTRRNYVIDVRTVLEWGMKWGAVRRNVTEGMPLPKGEREGEVSVLSVRDAARLVALARPRAVGGRRWAVGSGQKAVGGRAVKDSLTAGMAERDGGLLVYVVLGLFCGLRPEREMGLMRLSAINLEEGTVVVDAGSAKSRSRRVVDVPVNARRLLKMGVEWLRAQGEDRVVGRNFRKRWEGLRRRAGLEDWPADVMRHSYASYHFAMWQNENLLKAQLGHSRDSEVLWQHYRARVTRREAERYWRIGTMRR
jgi:integrase